MAGKTKMADACRRLRQAGFAVTHTRGGHLRFDHPALDSPVFAPSTPSDHRSITNLYALVKRKLRAANAAGRIGG